MGCKDTLFSGGYFVLNHMALFQGRHFEPRREMEKALVGYELPLWPDGVPEGISGTVWGMVWRIPGEIKRGYPLSGQPSLYSATAAPL